MTIEIFVTEVVIQLGLIALATLVLISQTVTIEQKEVTNGGVINPISTLYTVVLALGLFETLFYIAVR